jgi:glycosyltransferase involved in cell wall biosynthesis
LAGGGDIALVSLGTTPGLRRADEEFAALAREAGASCDIVQVNIGAAGKLRRQITATDLVEAVAARRAASRVDAKAVVYSTVTAALLQSERERYAVRFDSPAALNRPGVTGAWQRARERRVLDRATLLLPWGEQAARAAPGPAPRIPLPVPLPEIEPAPERDITATAYAGYPRKRGLDALCDAWGSAAPRDARLVIGGVERERGLAWLRRMGVPEPPGVEWTGRLAPEDWRALVARSRLFVNASRWEDHGLAQLEALAAGAALVTVPSPGAYEVLPLARRLDARLVSRTLAAASLAESLRAGLELGDDELAAYGERAGDLLAPYRRENVLARMRDDVLPRLLA